ncbi:MAG: response regulator [Verrucomicrobia bacterium]|nr:response regulator [Verrucomicrobiota bacterium]
MAYNILIVDDSLTARAFVARTLHMAGVPLNQVYEARNGQEALDLLEREWVDLVFADINMPVMNGAEMVKRMRTTDLLKSIPVVIVSTDRSAHRMTEMKEAGVQAYLTKPVTPEDLKTTVERFLRTA